MKKLIDKYGEEEDILPPALEETELVEIPKHDKLPSFEDFDPELINENSEYKYEIYKEKPKSKDYFIETIPPQKHKPKKATQSSDELLKLCSRYLEEALK